MQLDIVQNFMLDFGVEFEKAGKEILLSLYVGTLYPSQTVIL